MMFAEYVRSECVSAFGISQRGTAEGLNLYTLHSIFKSYFKLSSYNMLYKHGFELGIVVEILLSVFCSKDWNEKPGGEAKLHKY